jgi:hypothetical protein
VPLTMAAEQVFEQHGLGWSSKVSMSSGNLLHGGTPLQGVFSVATREDEVRLLANLKGSTSVINGHKRSEGDWFGLRSRYMQGTELGGCRPERRPVESGERSLTCQDRWSNAQAFRRAL